MQLPRVPDRPGGAVTGRPLVPDQIDLVKTQGAFPASTAMVADHGFLFVMRGDTIYKIEESTVSVVATGRLSRAAEGKGRTFKVTAPHHRGARHWATEGK